MTEKQRIVLTMIALDIPLFRSEDIEVLIEAGLVGDTPDPILFTAKLQWHITEAGRTALEEGATK